MTVASAVIVQFQRYSGYRDPRLPMGTWFGFDFVTGDASGGFAAAAISFQDPSTLRLSSALISVEEVSLGHNQGADIIPFLQAVNFSGPTDVPLDHSIAIEVNDTGVAGESHQLARSGGRNFLPWFLGSQRVPTVAASLVATFVNVDTRIFHIQAQGYWWDARSVLIDGGPQRPVSSLFT